MAPVSPLSATPGTTGSRAPVQGPQQDSEAWVGTQPRPMENRRGDSLEPEEADS